MPFIFECFHDQQHFLQCDMKYWTRKLHSHNASSFFFRWAKFKNKSFYDGFCIKQQHLTLSSARLQRFWQLQSHTRCLMPVSQEQQLHLQHHFLHFCACAQRTKQRNVFITHDHWSRNTVSVLETERVGFVNPCWLIAVTDVWISDTLAHISYIYWGSLWRQTFCCSVIEGKLQLKHAPATDKKVNVQD